MRYARVGQDITFLAEAISDLYAEYKTSVVNLTAYGSDDGAASVGLTGVTAVWDSQMDMFRITVPAANLPAEWHMFYGMIDWDGIIDVKFEFLMIGANGMTGTGGGNEQVLNAADYTFDATAKTITLKGDYATLELPQILRIKNVTKGLMVIYDCNDPDTSISYTAPVISYTQNFAYKGVAFANGDELQITVNKKS